MKILGILLAISGIFKFLIAGKIDVDDISNRFPNIDTDTIYEIVHGYLIFEGLVEVLCGAFIVFL